MAPEYAMHGIVSMKNDVFAFGVILLEIVGLSMCRSKPPNKHHHAKYEWVSVYAVACIYYVIASYFLIISELQACI